MSQRYRAARRPADVGHGYTVVVFDLNGQLNLPLTKFAKEAGRRLADGSVRAYLAAAMQFLTFLDTDAVQCRAERRWDSPPDQVRFAVEDYLEGVFRCKLDRRTDFQFVMPTRDTGSTCRVFLAAMLLFYNIQRHNGGYPYDNPFEDRTSTTINRIWDDIVDERPPRMPERSGVEPPRSQRLSDTYFKFVGGQWEPQIIDDPTFPAQVKRGGRTLKNWGLREECVTDLLFDTGARVSEVMSLTLADWYARGLKCEVNAINKGSHGKRVKFLRFSQNTAKLLRRYFDTERIKFDPNHRTLDKYERLARQGQVDLSQVPLFLSKRGTRWNEKRYREDCWNPACAATGLIADVHQTRHWYVTSAVRQIYHISRSEKEREDRINALILYMKWRGKERTLAAYQHYFETTRLADVQDGIHARTQATLDDDLAVRSRLLPPASINATAESVLAVASEEDDFAFLMHRARRE